MAELILVRHGQASFGAQNYDKLSPLGHRQAVALGHALRLQGILPDHFVIGSMVRHQETFEGIQQGLGQEPKEPIIHAGLNEYDFTGLLNARFPNGSGPEGMHTDRKAHFKLLKETIRAWQNDDIDNPPEMWAVFCERLAEAQDAIRALSGTCVLAVSSGGAIAQITRTALLAPAETQILLQLQIKNCSVHRFIYTDHAFYLHGFNETPHITETTQDLLSYS